MTSEDLDCLEFVADCIICADTKGEPKLLQCNHSVCLHCIENIIAQSGRKQDDVTTIQCPVCRRDIEVPEGGAAGFPTNYTLVQLRETLNAIAERIAARADQPEPTYCGLCVKDNDQIATHFCSQCSKFLCHQCAVRHKDNKVFVEHVIVSVHDADVLCLNHKDRVKYVCETCRKLLCTLCVAEDVCHDHDIKTVDDVGPKMQYDMREIIQEMSCYITQTTDVHEPMLHSIEHKITDVESSIEAVTKHAEEMEVKLKQNKDKLIQTLEARNEELKDMKQRLVAVDKSMELNKLRDAAVTAMRLGPEHVISALPNIKAMMPNLQLEIDVQRINKDMVFEKENSLELGKLVLKDTMQPVPENSENEDSEADDTESQNQQPSVTSLSSPMTPLPTAISYSKPPELLWEKQKFGEAWDVTFTPSGAIAISDCLSRKVVLYGADGNIMADTHLAGVQLGEPRGITYHNGFDCITVVDAGTQTVHFLHPSTLQAKKQALDLDDVIMPYGIGILSGYRMAVSDCAKHRITVRTHACIVAWGTFGTAPSEFIRPCYLCVDSKDRIIVSDAGNSRIQMFDDQGQLLKIIKTRLNISVNNPGGMCLDDRGSLFLVNVGKKQNQRVSIWKVDKMIPLFVTHIQGAARVDRMQSVALKGNHLVVVGGRTLQMYGCEYKSKYAKNIRKAITPKQI